MDQKTKERLFSELEEHLNNGCLDEHCEFDSSYAEFSAGFINHLIDIIDDTYTFDS